MGSGEREAEVGDAAQALVEEGAVDAGAAVLGEDDAADEKSAALRVWEPPAPDGPRLRGVAATATGMGTNRDRSTIVVGDEQERLTVWRGTGPAQPRRRSSPAASRRTDAWRSSARSTVCA